MDLKKLQKQIEEVARGGLRKLGVTTAGSTFFSGQRKGESAELQADLNSTSKTKQCNALKRIVASMSLGRDVSQLFADVVKLGQSSNLEVKKLVYLYVLTHARLQQEKALLAVNTFLLDCRGHPSPIIRALAIRTMLCLRVPSVLEYLIEPLKQAITVDGDPYVRKTAAMGILKIFHQDPKVIEDHGFIPLLVTLIGDSNSVVASNAAAVLHEILVHRSNLPGVKPIQLPANWANKLLHLLPEANEWGQVYILDLLATYFDPPEDAVENTIDRIIPRLSHLNPAVVFAAIKAVLQYVPRVVTEQARAQFLTRVNNALITLSRADSETQFVVIKNIQALLPIFPGLLRDKIDGFYVRFNDPVSVKNEKLRLMMMLMHKDNAGAIAKELEEYATDVDATFLVKVIHAVSIAAIKQESIAPRMVKILQNIGAKQHEMLPNVFNACKNLLRRHPNLATDLMKPLLTSIDHVSSSVADDLEATVSLVWILGEFCDVLANGMETLDYFTSNFLGLEAPVQNAIMSALVKLFLRNPAQVEPLLTPLFESATGSGSVDPDVRDRAFMYYRLLARGIGIEKMKNLVHSSRQAIDVTDCNRVNKGTTSLSEVLSNLNTAAVALEKPAKTFMLPYGLLGERGVYDHAGDDDEDQAADLPVIENSEEADNNSGKKKTSTGGASLDDLFDGPKNNNSSAPKNNNSGTNNNNNQQKSGGFDDIFGGGGNANNNNNNNNNNNTSSSSNTNNSPANNTGRANNDPFSSLGGNTANVATNKSNGSNTNNALDDMFGGGGANNTNNNRNQGGGGFDPFGSPAQPQQQQQQQPKRNAVDELFA